MLILFELVFYNKEYISLFETPLASDRKPGHRFIKRYYDQR